VTAIFLAQSTRTDRWRNLIHLAQLFIKRFSTELQTRIVVENLFDTCKPQKVFRVEPGNWRTLCAQIQALANAPTAERNAANRRRKHCISTAPRLHSDCETTAFSGFMDSQTELLKREATPHQTRS